MKRDDVINIIEKAFQCSSEEGVIRTQDQYIELEEHILGMLPKDLLYLLPLILINLLNENCAGHDVDVRIGDVVSKLNIGFDVKSTKKWDAYYYKIDIENTFSTINQEQSCAILRWLEFVDKDISKDECSWIVSEELKCGQKYWENRSKGLIKTSSRPSQIDDDKSEERPKSIL